MAQVRIVGREIACESALIVAGTPANGAIEQPLADTIFRATTQLADLSQQRRNVDGVAEPSSQRRAHELLIRFHGGTIAWGGGSGEFLFGIAITPKNEVIPLDVSRWSAPCRPSAPGHG
jgi:hypothetical protein